MLIKEDQIYSQYAARLLAVCMRYTGERSAAEDVLHDSFISIFKSLGRFDFRGEKALYAWMRKIAVNTCINAYHKRKKEEGEIDADDVAETIHDVRIQQNDFLSEEILLRFIQELPDGYRTVFNLFEIDGYSHQEISEMIGSSYTTVRTQLFKAKRSLKQKIEKYLGEEFKHHVGVKKEIEE